MGRIKHPVNQDGKITEDMDNIRRGESGSAVRIIFD